MNLLNNELNHKNHQFRNHEKIHTSRTQRFDGAALIRAIAVRGARVNAFNETSHFVQLQINREHKGLFHRIEGDSTRHLHAGFHVFRN